MRSTQAAPEAGSQTRTFFSTLTRRGGRERSGELDGLGIDVAVVVEARVFGDGGESLVVDELGAEAVHAAGEEDAGLDRAALGRAALLVDGR